MPVCVAVVVSANILHFDLIWIEFNWNSNIWLSHVWMTFESNLFKKYSAKSEKECESQINVIIVIHKQLTVPYAIPSPKKKNCLSWLSWANTNVQTLLSPRYRWIINESIAYPLCDSRFIRFNTKPSIFIYWLRTCSCASQSLCGVLLLIMSERLA